MDPVKRLRAEHDPSLEGDGSANGGGEPARADGEERRHAVERFLDEFVKSTRGYGLSAAGRGFVLESLEAADLKSLAEMELGVSPSLEALLDDSSVERLVTTLLEAPADAGGDGLACRAIAPDPANRSAPFPLTDIQQAYLVGRSGAFDLGTQAGAGRVATHVYLEFEVDDLDGERLEGALNRLVERHDMLRAIVRSDGWQQVLDDVPRYEIAVDDLRACDPDERAARLWRTREQLSHEIRPADRWPLFEVRVHRLDERRSLLHLSIDLLPLDGGSIQLLFQEWSQLYLDPDTRLPELELSFRDYVLALEDVRRSSERERAREYWLARLADLPPAPDLPFAAAESTAARRADGEPDARFVRRRDVLSHEQWKALKDAAHARGFTASGVLCAAYAEVLATWSKEPRFTLNVTLGRRLPLHRQVNAILGDFTSSVLLAVDGSARGTFEARAARLQRQLRHDIEHSLFSGVEVLRELARRSQLPALGMPVIFTSMLGVERAEAQRDRLTPFESYVGGVSQTPQVFLDNQVLERDGELNVTWDAIDTLFPAGMLDAMFAAYTDLLRRLAESDSAWSERRPQLVPREQLGMFAAANATDRELPLRNELLHTLVDRHVRERPEAIAVVAGERRISFGELDRHANRLARCLRECGAKPGTVVAVVMEKGWEQVVAVLAILRSGAAYLPVDARLPTRRLLDLVERGGADFVLTQSDVDQRFDWPHGLAAFVVDELDRGDRDEGPLDTAQGPDDLAYAIFTSGSTGVPSGVRIQHRAAVNTLADVIARFEIGPDDRVLGLSSLSFDLSVFDVFGVLGAGGTLVIPEEDARRDPARWAELIREHHITVWNSVPALLEMLVEYAAGRRETLGRSLRLALLSGDWIPLALPGDLRQLMPDARVVSLGGATEASIWSILHEIEHVDPFWASIPYGRAMANQRMHVLDRDLRPRPVWVPGELFVGGAGLAAGYCSDDAKTAERFVRDPESGELLYRTGDLGRWTPDGEIEFLGRVDFQVKVRGHRVELGEIEAVLAQHPAVEAAVVTAVGERHQPKRLVAYVVGDDEGSLTEPNLRAFVGERLPEYMVPAAFVRLDALPLSANGKIDRKALPQPDWGGKPATAREATADGAQRTDVEELLGAMWRDALGIAQIGPHDRFLDVGGDSLLAMRILARAGAAGIRLEPKHFLDNPTLRELSEHASTDRGVVAEQGFVTGDVLFTPAQAWFFEQDFADAHHWNGMWPLLTVGERLDPVLLGAALHAVLLHHDALRMRFHRSGERWRGVDLGPEAAVPVPFSLVDLSGCAEGELERIVERTCAERQASLDLTGGPLLQLTYFDLGPDRPGRLHMAAHWVGLDYYSSRVVFEDLLAVYFQLRCGDPPQLPAKTSSFQQYAEALHARAREIDVAEAAREWLTPARARVAPLPVDRDDGPNLQGSARRVLASLESEQTAALVHRLPRERGCEVREAIMTAVARAVCDWSGERSLLVEVESHGREEASEGLDVSRTVGRISTLTPVLVEVDPADEPLDSLATVMPQFRRCGRANVSYGVVRYLTDGPEARRLAELPRPQLGLNYWGNVDEYFTELVWPSTESPGPHRSAAGHRPRLIDVLAFVAAGELALVWTYSSNLHDASTVHDLATRAIEELRALVGLDAHEATRHVNVVDFDELTGLRREVGWRLPTAEVSVR
jgi:amino acid adenylation domain-containing protein/non-ribosomal peptide synthase protein (TIGR01720 family)